MMNDHLLFPSAPVRFLPYELLFADSRPNRVVFRRRIDGAMRTRSTTGNSTTLRFTLSFQVVAQRDGQQHAGGRGNRQPARTRSTHGSRSRCHVHRWLVIRRRRLWFGPMLNRGRCRQRGLRDDWQGFTSPTRLERTAVSLARLDDLGGQVRRIVAAEDLLQRCIQDSFFVLSAHLSCPRCTSSIASWPVASGSSPRLP